jgi:hypothetical protein
MSTFAQVLDGQVHWVFQAEIMPQFAPDIVILNITDVNPQPQEGWSYDATTDTYSEPVAPAPITPAAIPPTPAELTIMSALADMYVAIAALTPTTGGAS